MAATGSIRREEDKVPCPHCARGWIVDEVETTFGAFETVEYLCHMCCGTGRKMTKDERSSYWTDYRVGR